MLLQFIWFERIICTELADFYQLELQKVKRSTLWKKATPFVFILVLLIFVLGLRKYIESLPKQANPIEEFFKAD